MKLFKIYTYASGIVAVMLLFIMATPTIAQHSFFAPGMRMMRITDERNASDKSYLLALQYTDSVFDQLKLTSLYLISKGKCAEPLNGGRGELASCYDMSVSPNSKYLALYFVGEGHPWIEIYDLQWLLANKEYKLLKEINPYPGNVYFLKWKKNKLILESDIDLLKLQNGEPATELLLLETTRKYILHMNTLKIESY